MDLERGCLVIHNGEGKCITGWSTITPKGGEQGLVGSLEDLDSYGVWVIFSGFAGWCKPADLTVKMTREELAAGM